MVEFNNCIDYMLLTHLVPNNELLYILQLEWMVSSDVVISVAIVFECAVVVFRSLFGGLASLGLPVIVTVAIRKQIDYMLQTNLIPIKELWDILKLELELAVFADAVDSVTVVVAWDAVVLCQERNFFSSYRSVISTIGVLPGLVVIWFSAAVVSPHVAP